MRTLLIVLSAVLLQCCVAPCNDVEFEFAPGDEVYYYVVDAYAVVRDTSNACKETYTVRCYQDKANNRYDTYYDVSPNRLRPANAVRKLMSERVGLTKDDILLMTSKDYTVDKSYNKNSRDIVYDSKVPKQVTKQVTKQTKSSEIESLSRDEDYYKPKN